MTQLRPHHIGIVVSDLARSVAFYEALGFATTAVMESDDGSRTIQFMELGDLQVELFWYASPTAPGPRPDERAPGFRHLALRTDDTEAAMADLKARGVMPQDTEMRVVPGRFKLAYFDDPDGVQIEIMQQG
jgi:catechol 2,3-dioxygenase-like lactoylglutathione lyase family enzyme